MDVKQQKSQKTYVFIDHATRKCLIVEESVPFDVFVNDCYQSKLNRYLPLCQAITETGYDFKMIVLVVGSLSSVHCRFVSGLGLIGIPTSRVKRVAKYCSVNAMTGSRKGASGNKDIGVCYKLILLTDCE